MTNGIKPLQKGQRKENRIEGIRRKRARRLQTLTIALATMGKQMIKFQFNYQLNPGAARDQQNSNYALQKSCNDSAASGCYASQKSCNDSAGFAFSTGCFVSLFCVYAILAHLCNLFSPNNEPASMETVYPVFSVFALLSLHLFMYGCNLYMWKRTSINYNFIFKFSPRTSLKHKDAFLISAILMTTMVGAMVMHLFLRAASVSPAQIDALPGILLLFFITVLIWPFDIFYCQTRYFFLRVIRNVVCSPFYRVLLVDIFMANQLTSQIPLLRHLGSTVCHIVARVFKTHHPETCHSGRLYVEITYVISFMPYFWGAMQCARRCFDHYDVKHLANMGKNVLVIVAAGARLTYSRLDNHLWFVIAIITSVLATTYQLYWDFSKDWGFLNPNSRNPWLRDDLILKNKSIYFMSIALNIVLRVTWVEHVMHFKVGHVQSRLLDFLLAALEVVRRGQWNFYRLENEHLNNVGHYRAVKIVCSMTISGDRL